MVVSLVLLGLLSEQNTRLDQRLGDIRQLRIVEGELLGAVVDANTGVRGFLLTDDPAFLEPYEAARSTVAGNYRDISSGAGAIEISAVQGALKLASRQLSTLEAMVDTRVDMSDLYYEKRLMDDFRQEMDERIEESDAAISSIEGRRARASELSRTVMVGGGILSAAGVLLGGLLLIGGVIRRVAAVTEDARRLEAGEEMGPPGAGEDEIAQLDRRLHQTAHRLRARESELRQAKEEADRANRSKSEFLSRMSHELRTPLNAILGFAQIMRTQVKGDLRNDADQIHLAGRHLLDLINEVLDIARIEAGELGLSVEPVSITDVVSESLALVAGAADDRGIKVISDVHEMPLYAQADRQRLKQVILNLLSNAVKYNRRNGEVKVSCVREGSVICLSVADTGPGLPPGDVEAVFRPFARLGAETTEIEGTGLGLALSKNLVEAMDGELEVARTDSSGTEFAIRLPVSKSVAVTPGDVLHLSAGIDESPATSGFATILQVEDNPSNIRLIARILQRRPGVRLVTAQTGQEALDLALEVRPDLVLLDLNLPDMSGRDVLGCLRTEPETRDIPVVMLSADATGTQVDRLLKAGAVAYLTKPIDIHRLLSVVDHHLTSEEADDSRTG